MTLTGIQFPATLFIFPFAPNCPQNLISSHLNTLHEVFHHLTSLLFCLRILKMFVQWFFCDAATFLIMRFIINLLLRSVFSIYSIYSSSEVLHVIGSCLVILAPMFREKSFRSSYCNIFLKFFSLFH